MADPRTAELPNEAKHLLNPAATILETCGDASVVRYRALRGVVWNILGSVVGQGGTFLSSVVLARVVGKQPFGRFALIQSTAIALTSLASLGLGVTATKYVSEYRDRQPDKAGRILGLSSVVALATSLCSAFGLMIFASALVPDQTLVPGLRLSGICVFFITMNGYQMGALAGLEAFQRVAKINLLYGPAIVLFTWVLASLIGVPGGVLAQGLGAFVLWILYQVALNSECRAAKIRTTYRGIWQERAALIRFSIPATLSAISGSSAIWWCNLSLTRNSGYSELALFSAANNLRLMVMFLPALIARVTAPILNNLLVNGDSQAYRRTFWEMIAVCAGVALLLAVVLAVAHQQILRLFGQEFVGSTALIVVLLSSVVVEVIASSLYQAIFSSGSLWRQAGINALWTGVLVALALSLIPRYGATGLAASYLAAWCGSTALYAYVALHSGRQPLEET
jgi:O-antigen/teichoic acid export membrane protein